MKLQKNPFSHRLGVEVPLPRSSLICKCFPTKLEIQSLVEVGFRLKGPVRGFTTELDLEREEVVVFGESLSGFFRYRIKKEAGGVSLFLDRAPLEGILLESGAIFHRKERLLFPFQEEMPTRTVFERLFLGVTKPCNWDLVHKRFSLAELLPPLFLLAQKMPKKEAALMCHAPLESFLSVHFAQMCVPQLEDLLHQGIPLPTFSYRERTTLYSHLYQKVRALFFQREGKKITLFPKNSFEKGSLNLFEEGIGQLEMRWSKGKPRSIVLKAEHSQELLFQITGIKEFFLFVEKGKTYDILKN